MSSSYEGGPLTRWSSNSSTACASTGNRSETDRAARRETWASATWATGQNIITGMLYRRSDSSTSAHYYGKHQGIHQHGYFTTTAPIKLPLPPTAYPDGPGPSPVRQKMPSIDLPPLPRLLGNENLDEWDDILVRTLRLHGLAEFVTAPYPGVPEPRASSSSATTGYSARGSYPDSNTQDQWERNRALVCLLITGSLSLEVRDTLLACGYDPSETNPKAIYDLLREALPRAAGEDVPSWLRELNHISTSEPRFAGSLREYCLRLSYLRRRLYVAEPQPNDNLVLVMAILGLGRDARYQDLSMTLGQQLERGSMSWARFMGDLAGVHGRHVAERRMAKRKTSNEAV